MEPAPSPVKKCRRRPRRRWEAETRDRRSVDEGVDSTGREETAMLSDERLIDPNDRSFRSVKAYSIFHLILLFGALALSWDFYTRKLPTPGAKIWLYGFSLWLASHLVLTVQLFLRKRWASIALAIDSAPSIIYLVVAIVQAADLSGLCCCAPLILAILIYEGLLVVCYRNAVKSEIGTGGFEPIMKPKDEESK